MRQFDEAVLKLAIKLGYVKADADPILRIQFENALEVDVKLSFEKFLLHRNIIDRQKAKRLRASATSMIAPKIPGFNIIELLGGGGMGEVFKAKQIALDRMVALKVLSKPYHQNTEFLERFKREARIAGKIDNSNIVKAYDFFLGNSKKHIPPFFVMEFVEGKTLHEIIQKKKRLGEKQVIKIGISLANAIDSVARAGLVHRDIKPDNIIITTDGDIKLCDLGLAKEAVDTQNLTEIGITHGTPHFMSPEQAQGLDDLDYRADLYSLGCTLFKLLTGQPPYVEDSAIEILMKHISAPIPRISEFRVDVSGNLEEIIYLLLQKNPDRRYQSAKKLKNDLTAASIGETPKLDVSPDIYSKRQDIEHKLDSLTLELEKADASNEFTTHFASNNGGFLDVSRAPAIEISDVTDLQKVKRKNSRLIYIAFVAVIIFNLLVFFVFSPGKPQKIDELDNKPDVVNPSDNNGHSEQISPDIVRNAILKIIDEDDKILEQAEKENTEKFKLFDDSQK